jgi:hypothetical protein
VLLLLALSSLSQVVSGYVDVFSHRFIFTKVDPLFNPAHVSLYSASLLGFCAIYIGMKMKSNKEDHVIRPGITLAMGGAIGEIVSGVSNEVYHSIASDSLITEPLHLAIHGLFVTSMFVISAGGLVAVTLLRASKPYGVDQRCSVASLGILVSSIWLILLGSASYLTGLFTLELGRLYYMVLGSFFVSSMVVSISLISKSAGHVTVAAFSFYALNGTLIYWFTGDAYLLPLPVLAAAIGESLIKGINKMNVIFHAVISGAVFGALSYWLLYPYSYSTYFGFEILYVVLAGVTGGLIGLALHKLARNILSAHFEESMRS